MRFKCHKINKATTQNMCLHRTFSSCEHFFLCAKCEQSHKSVCICVYKLSTSSVSSPLLLSPSCTLQTGHLNCKRHQSVWVSVWNAYIILPSQWYKVHMHTHFKSNIIRSACLPVQCVNLTWRLWTVVEFVVGYLLFVVFFVFRSILSCFAVSFARFLRELHLLVGCVLFVVHLLSVLLAILT